MYSYIDGSKYIYLGVGGKLSKARVQVARPIY